MAKKISKRQPIICELNDYLEVFVRLLGVLEHECVENGKEEGDAELQGLLAASAPSGNQQELFTGSHANISTRADQQQVVDERVPVLVTDEHFDAVGVQHHAHRQHFQRLPH